MPLLPDALDPLVCALPDTPRFAYTTHVLSAEQQAIQTGDTGQLIRIRVLGALLIHSPSRRACDVVAQEIITAAKDPSQVNFGKLVELGEMYMHCFIHPFKRQNIRISSQSNHSSRSSSDSTAAWMEGELVNTPQNHADAKKNALLRDGFRCVLTGVFDRAIYTQYGMIPEDDNSFIRTTQCAHIMPKSTKGLWASKVWKILNRFGYGEILQELERSATHSLANTLTLEKQCHDLFDELHLWLEPVAGKEHTYTVRFALPILGRGLEIRDPVKFKVHDINIPGCKRPDPKYLPLPNPKYLELHAACCKVAHMSGANKYLDQIFRDMEEMGVLAEDGRSADVLTFAMSRLVAAPVYDSTNAQSECEHLRN